MVPALKVAGEKVKNVEVLLHPKTNMRKASNEGPRHWIVGHNATSRAGSMIVASVLRMLSQCHDLPLDA